MKEVWVYKENGYLGGGESGPEKILAIFEERPTEQSIREYAKGKFKWVREQAELEEYIQREVEMVLNDLEHPSPKYGNYFETIEMF